MSVAVEGARKYQAWSGACIPIGILGILASIFIGSRDGLAAIILTILLNPLAWLLPLGVWLENRATAAQTITPAPPAIRRAEEPHAVQDSPKSLVDDSSPETELDVPEDETIKSGEQEQPGNNASVDASNATELDVSNEAQVSDPAVDVEPRDLPEISTRKDQSSSANQSDGLLVVGGTFACIAVITLIGIILASTATLNSTSKSDHPPSVTKSQSDAALKSQSDAALNPDVVVRWSAGDFPQVIEYCSQTMVQANEQNAGGHEASLFVRSWAFTKSNHAESAAGDYAKLLLIGTPHATQLAHELQRIYDPRQDSFVLEQRLWFGVYGLLPFERAVFVDLLGATNQRLSPVTREQCQQKSLDGMYLFPRIEDKRLPCRACHRQSPEYGRSFGRKKSP